MISQKMRPKQDKQVGGGTNRGPDRDDGSNHFRHIKDKIGLIRPILKELTGVPIRPEDSTPLFARLELDTRRDRKGNMIDELKYGDVEVARYYKQKGVWEYLKGNLKTQEGKEFVEVEDGKKEPKKSVSSVVEEQAQVVLDEPVVKDVEDNSIDDRLLKLEQRESQIEVERNDLEKQKKEFEQEANEISKQRNNSKKNRIKRDLRNRKDLKLNKKISDEKWKRKKNR